MGAAILVVWAVGLAVALVLAIVVLRRSRLVIASLRELLAVSEAIAVAAHGIDKNVSVIPALPDLRPAAGQLAEVASAAGQSLHSIARQLERLSGTV